MEIRYRRVRGIRRERNIEVSMDLDDIDGDQVDRDQVDSSGSRNVNNNGSDVEGSQ